MNSSKCNDSQKTMKNNNLETKIFVKNIKQIQVVKCPKNTNANNNLHKTEGPKLSLYPAICSKFLNLT